MAVTSAQIKAEFKEFANTADSLIDAKIADATGLLDEGAFGMKYDQAVKYMACHLIALSPGGEFARIKYPHLEADGATTMYERRYAELKRSVLAMAVT